MQTTTSQPMVKYSIKDLEKLTGIKAHTIRIWEKRYGLISPERTSTNIRFYSDRDLRKLLNVSILNRNGLKISNIVTMDADEIHERIMDISEAAYDSNNQIEHLILAMIEFDELRFEKVLSSTIIKMGFDETVTKVLYPFFDKVGVLWQVGTIYPAQEHFVSYLIRQKLSIAIDAQSLQTNHEAKTFLMWLPSNEWHELGLLFYNYLIRKNGFKSIYLGQSVPFEDIQAVVQKQNIDYFFTSVTTPLPQKKYEEFVEQIAHTFPNKTIFVSGYQVQEIKMDYPASVIPINKPDEFLSIIAQLKQSLQP
ncbi:MAG: MerR family transcriptional regulator [Lentimicrobium sp.]|nr:MerR family transcriptional regulator [Lentimicrobium sp.]MDD2526454.1 MerR family transcriptional regulator [Lentimicrobiaceae bacterium]MDD4596411.1 MerR family transcriptional regulator [Lentimicrobiaceae bacterium]MDY0026504.1 MerR family transcriptional regulator [Lentimicrobium sp.]